MCCLTSCITCNSKKISYCYTTTLEVDNDFTIAIVWPYNCWMNDAIYLPMGNMNLPSLVEISKVEFKNKLRCYKFTDRHMVNKPNMIKWVTFLQGTEWKKCLKNIIWMNIFLWQELHDPWHFQNLWWQRSPTNHYGKYIPV